MHKVIERIDFDAFNFKDIKGGPLNILIEAYKICNKQLKPDNLIIKGFVMLTTSPSIVVKTLLSK
jgi:uncharacterized protein YdeI (BOF family)